MFTWIIEHKDSIIAATTAVVTAASAVANLTPTDSDNKAVSWLTRLINALALNFKK